MKDEVEKILFFSIFTIFIFTIIPSSSFAISADDPINEIKKLLASDGVESDFFGETISISGDVVVVGARFDDDDGGDSGSAYVFSRNQGGADNWGEVKKLTASDAAGGDQFGSSVSISGDIIVVGAHADDDLGTSSGSAYVFSKNQGGVNNWGEVKKITASDGAANDFFGNWVSNYGEIVVVSAPFNDDGAGASGSVYVFSKNQGGADNWGEVKELNAPDPASGDLFGEATSVSGDIIVVGKAFDDAGGTDSGAAYVFAQNNGGADNWGQVKKLTAPSPAGDDRFGFSVGVSGDIIAVGANLDDLGAVFDAGSVSIFSKDQGGTDNWGFVKIIQASDAHTLDEFGKSVSISGNNLLVGSYLDDDLGSASGSAYVYSRNEGGINNWSEVEKIKASDGAAGDIFGIASFIDGNVMVVGASNNGDLGENSGSAYVFEADAAEDADMDGVPDGTDNCPNNANTGQEDIDADATGDVCDLLNEINVDTIATSNFTSLGDLVVGNNSLFTIQPGVLVTIQSGSNLTVENGSGVLVKSGGGLQVNS